MHRENNVELVNEISDELSRIEDELRQPGVEIKERLPDVYVTPASTREQVLRVLEHAFARQLATNGSNSVDFNLWSTPESRWASGNDYDIQRIKCSSKEDVVDLADYLSTIDDTGRSLISRVVGIC